MVGTGNAARGSRLGHNAHRRQVELRLQRITAMSKNNNVNPGQYKVAGRERQGEDIDPQKEKATLKVKENTDRHLSSGRSTSTVQKPK